MNFEHSDFDIVSDFGFRYSDFHDASFTSVLINIFGGIVRCDLVASGIVKAAKELGLKIPMVVRLEGTNVEQGKIILEESGLSFQSASSMQEAADKVVPLATQGQ